MTVNNNREHRIQLLRSIGCSFVRCPSTDRVICVTSSHDTRAVCICRDRVHVVQGLTRATAAEYVDQ